MYATGSMNVGSYEGRIEVFGPGDRGSLPRVYPPGQGGPLHR